MAMTRSIDAMGKTAVSEGADRAANRSGASRVSGVLMAAFRALGCMALQAVEGIARAHARGAKRKQMKLVESLPLGNRRQLLLIDCGNQRYLVGAGADSVGSILAMERGAATGDVGVKRPELVWRRESEGKPGHRRSSTAAEAGPALWR